MRYIKDFFYNLSDLFIILLILGLAAGLIYWRFGIIMNYPEALAAEIKENGGQGLVPDEIANGGSSEGGENGAENGDNADGGGESGDANGQADANSGNSGDANSGDNNGNGGDANGSNNGGDNGNSEAGAPIDAPTEQEPGSGPRDNTIWKDGKLRVDMNVELASGSSEVAIESLVQAGLFSSYEDFVAVCENYDLDPEMVAARSYTFPAGSTQEDIAREVTME